MNRRVHGKRERQRGVAVVTALLIAALIAVMTAQWFVAQDALGRTIEVQRAGAQARWLLTGATDWAIVILRDLDDNKQLDHLGEPWAQELAPTRLTDERGQLEAFGSGYIKDAQGRFNLADLTKDGGLDGKGIAALQ
ncbi:MAG: type secretion system minor pseudopilin GspK, partial [Pseudomonadota bacterium]